MNKGNNNLYKKIFIVVAALIILILSVVLIRNLTSREPDENYSHGIIIDGFSDAFPEVSNTNKLYYYLYLLATSAEETPRDEEIPDPTATIRENTAIKNGDHGLVLVDIPELEQSYQITFKLQRLSSEDDFSFSCPAKRDVIYPNTICDIFEDEFTLVTSWNHEYMISGIIPDKEASKAKEAIEKFVLSDTERYSAPKDTGALSTEYGINILENSYNNITTSPDYIYSLDLEINDGRTYHVVIRYDSTNLTYVAVFITRTDLVGHSHGAIYTNSNTSALTSWLKTLSDEAFDIDYYSF